MSQGSAQGIISQGGGGATNSNFLIATVPAGAVLTKVDAFVELNSETVSQSFAAGDFATFNLMAGVQWVDHGSAAADITASPQTAGLWLTFDGGFYPLGEAFTEQATTTFIVASAYRVRDRWRGQFIVPQSLDIYWSYGEDTALTDTINLRAFGNYYVEWGVFP